MTTMTIDQPTRRGEPPAAPAPVSRTQRVRAAHQAMRGRPLGAHIAPWPVTALLWAGAAAGHAGGTATEVVAVVAPVVAVVWWWRWSRRRTRDQRRARRLHAAVVTIAAAGWLVWALQAGPGGWRAAVLWCGMVAVMQPYWRRRRISVPPADVAEVVEAIVGGVVEKWAERVQGVKGALPGSSLVNHQRVRNGESWDIMLVPGVQVTGQAIAAQPRIVSALDHLTVDQVIVDRHPSGSMARAKLTVVEGHPLNRTLHHPGPGKVYNRETGYAAMGLHPDDQPAEWGFYIPGWGLAGGFVAGGIGSGKSTVMTNLGTTACHTGYLTVWAGCPVGGQSFPALIKHASWPATTVDEIVLQLEALARLILIRGHVNGLLGRDLHVPTAAEPGVLLFLDEFHKVTAGHKDHKRAAALLSLITREGRKASVAVIGADQDVDLQGVFANDDTLRTSMFAKNLWVGRTPSHVFKGMIPGLDMDPADLPEQFPDGSPTSGLGYLVGKRTAPCRGWFTPNADELLATAPKLELEKVGAKSAGDNYLNRRERALQAKAGKALALASIDPALMAGILAANPDLASAVEQLGGQVDVAASDMLFGQPERKNSSDDDQVDAPGAIPDAPRFDFTEPAEPRTTVRDRVLALIDEGVTTTGELQSRTGASETAVRDALNGLMADGAIGRVKKGVYTSQAA